MPSSPGARGGPPVIQLVPSLQHGDAVSHHALHLGRQLARAGHETHLFARFVEPGLEALGEPDSAYLPWLGVPHLLVFHYALYCDNAVLYRASPARKLLVYHNITPHEFFDGYSPALARECALGRLDLPTLAGCDLAVADSAYNAGELAAAGFDPARIAVLPPSPQAAALDATRPGPAVRERHAAAGTTNILFVGRVTPNKAHEDLIKAFALYRRHFNPDSRLFLVGSRFLPLYDQRLLALAAALGVGDAVVMTGRVTLSELRAYYDLADLFLCLSRHEGFCVPLVEAMHLGVPIVARPATAVPETLGGAGLLVGGGHGEVAAAIDRVVRDAALRGALVAAGRARAADFAPARLEGDFAAILARFAGEPAGAAAAARASA
jgi:glycosyltransferase involved in cell wall biosynthesis